jgi:hypothetical protein
MHKICTVEGKSRRLCSCKVGLEAGCRGRLQKYHTMVELLQDGDEKQVCQARQKCDGVLYIVAILS